MTGRFVRTFPPPANWQDFERLAFDLYSRIWKTNDAELHGRIGQPQSGVDIYGTDRVENRFTGVQCKGKEQGYDSALALSELNEEVEKAKGFRPKLEVFVLATTAPNDIALQQAARDISAAHRDQGLFEVRVTGWKTLQQKITDHADLVQKYYSDLAPIDVVARIGEVANIVQAESVETRTIIESGYTAIITAMEKSEPGDPLQERITAFAKLMEDGKPAAARDLLETLWCDEQAKASPRNRYRMRANIGVAKLVMGDVDAAVDDMRAAYAEDPTWPGAQAILATAELHSGNRAKAFELATKVLAQDPTVAQAAAVLSESASDDLSAAAVEELVPAGLREKPEVLLTLAHRAHQQGDAKTQQALVIRAAVGRSDDWRVMSAQAEQLLTPVFSTPGIIFTHAVPPTLVGDLAKAIDLLQKAWAQLRQRDNARMGAYVGANLLSALAAAGRDAEYELTLDEALKIAPSFEPFLRKYAEKMAESHDWVAAKKAMDAIAEDRLQAQDRLARVQIDINTGNAERAITDAAAMELELRGDRLAEVAAALHLEAAFAAQRESEILPQVLERWPKSVLLRSLAHNFLTVDDSRRAALLAEIQALAETINEPADRMHAADALYNAKQFSAAADLYQGLFAPDRDTGALSRGLRSLLFAERRREARALFERLSDPIRKQPFYADLGVAIYEHSGLLKEAKALVEATLAEHDTLRRRLHWISIAERLAELDNVKQWLTDVPEDISGDPYDRMQLALAQDRVLNNVKALPIGYRALRDGYNDPRLHLGYMIGLVFMGRTYKRAFKTFQTVEADTAVLLDEKDGERKLVRVLETLASPDILREEVALTDPLAVQLLGKRVGDEIEIPSLGLEPTIYIIREIRDKHLQAHFRSQLVFETLFPGHPAFGSFKIDESKGDEKFKPLFDSVKKRGEHGAMLVDLYRKGQTALMLLSRFSGNSPCDTWEWILSQPDVPFRVCHGSPELEAACNNMMGKDQPRAVVDPITLYALTRLGIAEKVKGCFAELGVVQTTLDMLRRLVHERGEGVGREQGSLGWDGEHFNMVQAHEDVTKMRVRVAQEALDFAQSLTLVPSEPDAGIKPEAVDIFEDCDPAFLDTIYAAQGQQWLLLSDDIILRALAKEIAGVDGVWTQSSAMAAARKALIAARHYMDIVSSVAVADYQFTTVDNNIFAHQLAKDEWIVTPALRVIFGQVALPSNDPASIDRLVSETIRTFWLVPPARAVLPMVLIAIFRAIRRVQPDRDFNEMANAELTLLGHRLQANSNQTLYKRRLMSTSSFVSVERIRRGVNRHIEAILQEVATLLEDAISACPPAS